MLCKTLPSIGDATCSGTKVSWSRGPLAVFPIWSFQLSFYAHCLIFREHLAPYCMFYILRFNLANASWNVGDLLVEEGPSLAYLEGAWSSVFHNFVLFLPYLLECHPALLPHAVRYQGWSTLEAWTSGYSSQGRQCSVKCSFPLAWKNKILYRQA